MLNKDAKKERQAKALTKFNILPFPASDSILRSLTALNKTL